VEVLDMLTVLIYVMLAVVFVPSVLFFSNSKSAIPFKQPQVHRPFAVLLVGAFCLLFGLFCVYQAFSAVHSGTVDCPLKMCMSSFSLDQPIAYWTSFAVWYGSGVILSGTVVALVRKAFSPP
jgi:hypothetical protein